MVISSLSFYSFLASNTDMRVCVLVSARTCGGRSMDTRIPFDIIYIHASWCFFSFFLYLTASPSICTPRSMHFNVYTAYVFRPKYSLNFDASEWDTKYLVANRHRSGLVSQNARTQYRFRWDEKKKTTIKPKRNITWPKQQIQST